MKKIYLTLLLLLFTGSFGFAQFGSRVFKPFKVMASMGYVFPRNVTHEYPLNFQLEPKYAFNDALWIGLRLETTLLVQRALLGDDYKAQAIFAILPTFDYSFVVNDEFRPFVGVGFGSYTYKLYYDGSETDGLYPVTTKFGFCPRIGLEYKHFILSLEHNFLPKDGISFSAIKAGFTIGGGTVD